MTNELLKAMVERPQSLPEEAPELEQTPSPHEPLLFGGFPMDPQTSFDFDSLNSPFGFEAHRIFDNQSSQLALESAAMPRQRQKRRFYVNPANLSDPMGSFANFYSKYESDNDAELVSFLGVTKKQFDQLMTIVGPRIQCKKSHQRPIPTEVRLAIFLRSRNAPHLSTNSIAKDYSTVSMIVKQVARELNAPVDGQPIKEEDVEKDENAIAEQITAKLPNESVQLRSWTEEEQDMLIFATRQCPELCNRDNLSDHSKFNRLHQLFLIITEKLNTMSKGKFNAIEAIVEWNRLWQVYDRERSAAELGIESKWPHYEIFESLANGSTAVTEKPHNSPASDSDSGERASQSEIFNGNSPKPPHHDSQLNGIVERLTTAKRKTTPPNQIPEKRPRNDAADPNGVFGKLEEYVVNVVRKVVNESKKTTEFDNYGQMIGSRLRELAARDPEALLEARHEIDLILYRHEKASLQK